MIKISEINIRKIKEKRGVVAVTSCVMRWQEFAFFMDKIGIVARNDGTFSLSFPKYSFGEQKLNYYHPINKETTNLLHDAIINRYKRFEEATDEDL